MSTYGLLILDLLLKEGLLVRHVALLRVVCERLKSLRLGQRGANCFLVGFGGPGEFFGS